MGSVVQFTKAVRRRPGVCAHCMWSCGPLGDSCDAPTVMMQTGRMTVKALAARQSENICGASGKCWEEKP